MTASEEINGPIGSAHQWVNMTNVTVQHNATHTVMYRQCHILGRRGRQRERLCLPYFSIIFFQRGKHASQLWDTALPQVLWMDQDFSILRKASEEK